MPMEPEKQPPAAANEEQADVQQTNGAGVAAAKDDLQAALEQALKKADENQDSYLRAKAEAENTRRRAQDDVAKAYKFAIESFAEALVPVMDSLEKALEIDNASVDAVREGVNITLRQLQAAFEKNRLLAIDPKGEKFDPHKHQAISMVPAPEGVPANHVVDVLQKGWTIAERVLRPALVTVAQAAANKDDTSGLN